MTVFKVVNGVDDINLFSNWTHSRKVYNWGGIVGENGKPITAGYRGKKYMLISQKERDFTPLERIGRGFLGIVATVVTLGIAILFKSIRNFFTQGKAKIRLAVEYNISEEELQISKEELQRGMDISKEMIIKIQSCVKNILQSTPMRDVKLYDHRVGHLNFSLETVPGFIFKLKNGTKDDSMLARYQAMIQAQTVCRIHQLGLLVIPNAKLFNVEVDGKQHEIIAEKLLNLDSSEDDQKQRFKEYASSLNEAIRQLAVFICKTGYFDVAWRNNPVLNDDPNEDGCRKIGLIDLEDMGKPELGLFGGGWVRGLVRCVTEEQGKIVLDVAQGYGISTSSFFEAHTRRKEEIAEYDRLENAV